MHNSRNYPWKNQTITVWLVSHSSIGDSGTLENYYSVDIGTENDGTVFCSKPSDPNGLALARTAADTAKKTLEQVMSFNFDVYIKEISYNWED
jgi:hypothetical protein